MPFTEIGKAAQSAIYRAGTFGRRPKVPTDGNALEDAARRVMSRRGFAYVAGQPVARRPRRPTGRPSPGGGSCRGCSSTPPSATSGSTCSGAGTRHRCSSLRSGCCPPHTKTPTWRWPGRPSNSRSPRSSAPRRRCRWRTSPRSSAAPATGTSCTGAATTTSSRAWSVEPRRAAARPSWSPSTPPTSGGDRATSTSGTCRSPAARASRSTPPTRSSAGSSRSASPPRRRPSRSHSRDPPPPPCAPWCR